MRRCDYLVNLAQSLIETILFYHPVVWWLSHRIRVEREQSADDIAQGYWANRGAWPLRFPNWNVSSSQPGTWPRRPMEEIS